MKGEDLFSALGKIDEKYVENSAPKKMPVYKRNAFKWVWAAAACVCLLVMGYSVTSVLTARDGALPKIENYAIHFESMGYEGTDELAMQNTDDINPWNEDIMLETLPVYKNLRYNGGKLSQSYYSADELRKQAEAFAYMMGLNIIDGKANPGETEGEVYNYVLDTRQGTVSTNGAGISLNLKKGYEYLLNKHISYCFGSETEKVSGVYRKYSIDGELLDEENRSYYKYGDITDNIISFNLQSHWQGNWSDGTATYTNSRNDDYLSSSEKLGDYPVITLKQAKEKLLRGEYIDTAAVSYVEGGEITEDVIVKTDLIYYTNGNQKYHLPYYRFYVKCYSGNGEIQRYAYIYVCAVEDEYLGSYEKFDGHFQ